METIIDKGKTALVVIDLQKGIVGRTTAPYSSSKVVTNSSKIAEICRKHAMQVFLVHVTFSPDGKDRLKPKTDESQTPSSPKSDWADFVPEIGPKTSDYVITKRNWGAFYGTDLELQLRRRGIDTIILTGISTNYGVESTARFAYEYGFNIIFIEDATSSFSEETHNFPYKYIFPRIGLIRKTQDILEALD
jgi:nicotinamidase-related amidase